MLTTVHKMNRKKIYLLAMLFLFLSAFSKSSAQIIDDGQEYSVLNTGSFQDLVLPNNPLISKISFSFAGADGGAAILRMGQTVVFDFVSTHSHSSGGGNGAVVNGTFLVGSGPGKIPLGSTIRFIIGQKGVTGVNNISIITDAGTGSDYGSGGGGTAILYKIPGGTTWTLLGVAGGGGGAYQGVVGNVPFGDEGGAGEESENGADGGGALDYGGGGISGNGGQASFGYYGATPTAAGGGGRFTKGDGMLTHIDIGSGNISEEYQFGEGGAGAPGGSDVGGYGGTKESQPTLLFEVRNGGFGYGGGGAGAGAGGGGGGYSGGGGGGVFYGGGGGGSYLNGIRESGNVSGGGSDTEPDDGVAYYQVTLNQPPLAICKNGTVYLSATGQASIVAADVDNGSNDPDNNPLTYSLSKSSFTCADIGNNNVTLTVTDNNGAASTCTALIRVVDNAPPVVTCPPVVTVFAVKGKCNAIISDAKLGKATASDNCTGQLTIVKTGIPAGNIFPVGVTIITYKTTDAANNTGTCTQTITVVDNQDPVINCPRDIVVTAPNNSCSKTVNYTITATDNCSVKTLVSTPASGSVFNVGKTIVVVIATDASGNTSTTSFTVTVKDNTPPLIICPPNVTVNTEPGLCKAIVNPGTATATDNCSVVAITGKRSDNKPLNAYYPVGTTTITWKAKDASGNTSTCEQKIKVKDNQPPVITNVNVNPAVLWPADHSMKTVIVNYNSTDNCGPDDNCSYDCQLSVTSNEPVSGTGNGDLSPDWQIIDAHKVKLRAERKNNGTGRIYTIKITCTDEAGNKSIQTIAVTVPLTAPTITSSQNTKMTQGATEKEIPSTLVTGFMAQVMPNPAEREFNLVIKGGSNEPLEIRIFDITGRQVQQVRSAASNVIRFGDNLVQGTYIVEVRQGKNKAVLKVVKQ